MNIFKKLFGKKKVEEEETIDITPAEKHLIYMCAKYEELTDKKIMILILKEYKEMVKFWVQEGNSSLITIHDDLMDFDYIVKYQQYERIDSYAV